VNRSIDSVASLDLARRLSEGSKQPVRTLLVASDLTASDDLESSIEWLKRVAPETTPEPISLVANEPLSAQIPDNVVVIDKDVVTTWHIPFEELAGKRSLILVQGAGNATQQPDSLQIGVNVLPASAT